MSPIHRIVALAKINPRQSILNDVGHQTPDKNKIMTYRSLFLSIVFVALAFGLSAQAVQLSIAAQGTGRTTGHIAELSITNQGDQPVNIAPGMYYIPSANRYQSYVGRIPRGHTVPPGQTVSVPVDGYCTDVHTPPVPSGESMPNFQDWVMVSTIPQSELPGFASEENNRDILENGAGKFETAPTVPEPMNPPGGSAPPETPLVPDHVVPPFSPDDIPDILSSSAYQEYTEQPGTSITITFPQTDIPLGGTFDPSENPQHFASLVVAIVTEVEDAAGTIQDNPDITTPFSAAPPREHEALVQQTIWMVTATLTGDEYTKEDFTENTHRQFTQATGRSVESLPEEERERLDGGVDDFWDAFSAVGVEAKVFSVNEGETSDSAVGQADLFNDDTASPVAEEIDKENNCQCEKVEFNYLPVAHHDNGPGGTVGTPRIPLGNPTKSFPFDGEETEMTYEASKLQNRFNFSISDIAIFCKCSDSGTCTTSEGPFLDLGKSKGANEVDRAVQEAIEQAQRAAEEAAEQAREAVERVSEEAEETASDEGGNSNNSPAAPEIDGPLTESIDHHIENDQHRIEVKLPRGQEKTIRFTISGTCRSGDCGQASCIKTIVIKITRPNDE